MRRSWRWNNLARATLCLAACGLLVAQSASGPRPAPSIQATPAQEKATRIQPPPLTYHFPDGVTYTYRGEWRLWNAGIGTLRVERTPSGEQHLVATADATGFVALLYHVHDFFDSTLQTQNFCSLHLLKRTEEGYRRRETDIHFDYARHLSVMDDINLNANQKRHGENMIPECVTDVLSALLYAGSLPLEPGVTYSFPINDGGSTVEMRAQVEGREQIHTDAGTFNTLRVRPDAPMGILKSKGKIWIWYSDDAQHIPVQMRGRMGWGSLTLRLQRIDRKPATSAAK